MTAIYDIATGEIRVKLNCPYSHIDIQVKEGEEFFLNCPDDATCIEDGSPK